METASFPAVADRKENIVQEKAQKIQLLLGCF
jgi:hypothetical protein